MSSNDAASLGDPRRPRDGDRMPSDLAESLHAMYAEELLAFLMGVLRNIHDANEVLQTAFRRLLEAGHLANRETLKGWLFKVALNEALILKRNSARQDRILRDYSQGRTDLVSSDWLTIRNDELTQLRGLLFQLPVEQQQVIRARIYEDKTFAAIAAELNVPLGTVLTRMRLALEKLRKWLSDD